MCCGLCKRAAAYRLARSAAKFTKQGLAVWRRFYGRLSSSVMLRNCLNCLSR
jgi:hypothetical protein